MGQPVVVAVDGGQGDADQSAAFNAGAAVVIAAQAAETAETAAEKATQAAADAESAARVVYATADDIASLRADVEALGERFMDTLVQIVDIVKEDDAAQGTTGNPNDPDVVVAAGSGDVTTGGAAETTSKRERKPKRDPGDHWWFGKR